MFTQSAEVIFFPRQLDYNIVSTLFQALFERGRCRMYILRASRTTKDGSKIYARDYGKRAFRIWVGPGPEPSKKK